jgi:hypothetical protein
MSEAAEKSKNWTLAPKALKIFNTLTCSLKAVFVGLLSVKLSLKSICPVTASPKIMPKVLFVHGTGVRLAGYEKTLKLITAKLEATAEVLPCYWGDLGSSLGASGRSIPAYDSTRGSLDLDAEPIDPQAYSIALWQALLLDPLHELRSLVLKPHPETPGFLQTQGERLIRTACELPLSEQLLTLVHSGDIESAAFESARRALLDSRIFRMALEDVNDDLADHRVAVARAWIATAASQAHEETLRRTGEWWWPALVLDVELRSRVEQLLIDALGGDERGIPGWVMQNLSWPLWWLTHCGVNRRGAISDVAYPATGDILQYQARGEAIRARIRERILAAPEPVHLLAHSLGGVACVDLLATEELPVRQLITVGSQAPFLYELNALPCLPFGQPLPSTLPPWLNLYDPHDFLSYIGASIFPGGVVDRLVNNRQAFPASHSAYWSNSEVWAAIHSTLPR